MESKRLKHNINSSNLPIHKILQPKRQNGFANSFEENQDPQKSNQDLIKIEHQEKNNSKLTTSLTVTSAGSTFSVVVPKSKKGVITMAKRNARERNRVKQVNQGYVTLLNHIPEAFRQRKMSKVQTLKSAVDYIMNLQITLGNNEDCFSSNPVEQDSKIERENMESLNRLLSGSVCENNISMYGDETVSSASGISFQDQSDLEVEDYVYNDPDLDGATCFHELSEMDLVQENQEQKPSFDSEIDTKESNLKLSAESVKDDETKPKRTSNLHIKTELN